MYVAQGITEEEHRAADISIRRRQLALREAELRAAKRGSFWKTAASVASATVPLLTFLGLQQIFKGR